MNRCLAGDDIMVYKYIDIVGTSNTDMSAAVDNAWIGFEVIRDNNED